MARFMVLVKASPDSEANVMPNEQMLKEMTAYNEELARAGVLLMADGLRPSSFGARVYFSDSGTKVVDGPFAESKELVAGFWILECKSFEECLEWARRAPNPMPGYAGSHTEIRPFFEEDDFGAELTPELRSRERAIAEQIGTIQSKS
jgi:hypothetical protein